MGLNALKIFSTSTEFTDRFDIRAGVYRHSKNIEKVFGIIPSEFVYKYDSNIDDIDLDKMFQGVDLVISWFFIEILRYFLSQRDPMPRELNKSSINYNT